MALHFWVHEVAQFGPIDGSFTKDLVTPFLKLKLGKTSTLTMLSLLQIHLANFELQFCFQKFAITNHCALYTVITYICRLCNIYLY